jgi:PRTRC genetic system protein B
MKDVEINCSGDNELALETALLFYSSPNIADLYITQHDVRFVDGRPVLLPGVPLALENLATFADIAAQRTSYRGFIHERLLYLAPNTLAWWLPACRRRVWFDTDGVIGERAGECSHPPLLFVVNKRQWSVFALRTNARPRADTPLCVAPYFNVWDDGQICIGNADVPEGASADNIGAFENAFFRSRFTHTNHDELIHRDGGAVRLWLDLLDGAEFPLDCLIDAKRTLAQAIGNPSDED